jgi:hypothetical protein
LPLTHERNYRCPVFVRICPYVNCSRKHAGVCDVTENVARIFCEEEAAGISEEENQKKILTNLFDLRFSQRYYKQHNPLKFTLKKDYRFHHQGGRLSQANI